MQHFYGEQKPSLLCFHGSLALQRTLFHLQPFMFSSHLSHTLEPEGVVSAFHALHRCFQTYLSSLKILIFQFLVRLYYTLSILLLCVAQHSGIFSLEFFLYYSHTLPVIILIIIQINLFKTQGFKFHDIFFHRGLVIHSSGFIRINPRPFHYKNCNYPHCLLSPKILTSLSSLSMVSLYNHS